MHIANGVFAITIEFKLLCLALGTVRMIVGVDALRREVHLCGLLLKEAYQVEGVRLLVGKYLLIYNSEVGHCLDQQHLHCPHAAADRCDVGVSHLLPSYLHGH